MRKKLKFDFHYSDNRPWLVFGIGFTKWSEFLIVIGLLEFRIIYE